MVEFIENKTYNLDRVSQLLEKCAVQNMWANRGPLYWQLAESFTAHMQIPSDQQLTPCANGGIALESMARLHDIEKGQRINWLGSAFSFKNIGRGYFSDMVLVDCDKSGLLDLAAVKQIDSSKFDGIIVTNPHGLATCFDEYIQFSNRTGKPLLIDNAAGTNNCIPDWPWQAFSLHHTKPYGFGEGGLALTPKSRAEDLYALIDYGDVGCNSREWVVNGKLSDISCAYILDRLASYEKWEPLYSQQRDRIVDLVLGCGLKPLIDPQNSAPTTSVPFIAEYPVARQKLQESKHVTFAKYYQPLAETPNATWIFERIVNIPNHPDMAQLTDAEILSDIKSFMRFEILTG